MVDDPFRRPRRPRSLRSHPHGWPPRFDLRRALGGQRFGPRLRDRAPLALLSVAAALAAVVPPMLAASPVQAASVSVRITSVPNGLPPEISCWQFSPANCIFDPSSITVPAGTEVIWVNGSGSPDLYVAADDNSFSVPVPVRGSGSHVFGAPGTFHYHGPGQYSGLRGTVTVLPPPTPPPPPPPPPAAPPAAPHAAVPAAAVALPPTAAPTPPPTPEPTPDISAIPPLPLAPLPTPSPRATHHKLATISSPGSGRSPWFYLAALLIFAAVLALGTAFWRQRQQRDPLPPAPHPSQVLGMARPPLSAAPPPPRVSGIVQTSAATPAPDHGGWLEL